MNKNLDVFKEELEEIKKTVELAILAIEHDSYIDRSQDDIDSLKEICESLKDIVYGEPIICCVDSGIRVSDDFTID